MINQKAWRWEICINVNQIVSLYKPNDINYYHEFGYVSSAITNPCIKFLQNKGER